MRHNEIKALQERVGTTPDGFWGPKSIVACQWHLRSLMPSPNPWPEPTEAALQAFYGSPGDESQLALVDAPIPLFFEGKRVPKIRAHKRCVESLCRALVAAYAIRPQVVTIFDGIYNNRPMRGGILPSLHARGAAIDLHAGPNGNRIAWPVMAPMPIEVMECFAKEGWLSAGAFWGRDAMHFQATR